MICHKGQLVRLTSETNSSLGSSRADSGTAIVRACPFYDEQASPGKRGVLLDHYVAGCSDQWRESALEPAD